MNSLRGKQTAIILAACLIFGIIGAWLLISLYKSQYVDTSLITGTPCAPPCWQGIEPGVSTREEALAIISESPFVKPGSIRPAGDDREGGFIWDWRGPGKWLGPGMRWKDDVIQEISMGLTMDLTVEEALAKFGTPEAVHAVGGGVPEHWYWILALYYPSQGIELHAYTAEYSSQVTPSDEIGIVNLFHPITLDERIDHLGFSVSNGDFPMWKGYGDVAELYINQR